MEISLLKKLGLGDKEIKVYLTLLEYGAISVRGLADLSKVNRGTVYDILKKLQDQGLVSYYHQDTKQKFVAENPQKLTEILKQKNRDLKNLQNGLSELIPELSLLQDKGEKHPTSKLYEGDKGIKIILDDVLECVATKKDKEYFVYSATESSKDINRAFPKYSALRVRKKIKVKAISLSSGGKTHGLDKRRWLGTHDESATFILIYAGKCAFVSRGASGRPVGVIIENKMIYQTQKIIFLKLWDLLRVSPKKT